MIISKPNLVDNIKAEIVDNSKGSISPHDIRHNLLDLIDSLHLLTEFQPLKSTNVDTASGSRTTRFGDFTLENLRLGIDGYTSVDNTAVGYASLNKSFSGYANTAVGSNSLNCNIHGHNNVGLGFNAVAANTTGYGNVGVGNYSIHNNKTGNLNIAIGHGAGYYIDKDDSSKLFISSHNVDKDYICSNPEGEGLVPLIQGDLNSTRLRVGIAVSDLHTGAALQVGGSIHTNQSSNYTYNLGSFTYKFKNLFLNDSVFFGDNNYIRYNSLSDSFDITGAANFEGDLDTTGGLHLAKSLIVDENLTVGGYIHTDGSLTVNQGVSLSGDIIPQVALSSKMGSAEYPFLSANFHNIKVTGLSKFNKFEAIEQSHYLHKTIYLASKGYIDTVDGGGVRSLQENYHPDDNIEPPVGYLNDEELAGAGLNIYSSDSAAGYTRDYYLQFRPQDHSIKHPAVDTPYTRSSWYSNISLTTANGCHIKTDRVLSSDTVAMLNDRTGIGVFLRDRYFNSDAPALGVGYADHAPTYSICFGDEDSIKLLYEDGDEGNIVPQISGYQDVEFIAPYAVNNSDYDIRYLGSQYTSQRINQHFDIVGTGKFTLSYWAVDSVDNSILNPEAGQTYDRFIIHGEKEGNNRTLMVMNHGNDGTVGINDFTNGQYMTPDTILNVRATGDAILRVTAENSATTKSALQLLTQSNCLDYGADIFYDNSADDFNLDMYYNGESSRTNVIKATTSSTNKFGIYAGDQPNSMLTIGNPSDTQAALSICENSSYANGDQGYGKIFVRPVDRDQQSNVINFVDSSGNYFELAMNGITTAGGAGTITDITAFADGSKNTLLGTDSPLARSAMASSNDNTTMGYKAFQNISTGDRNTFIGSEAGVYAQGSVESNVCIGYRAGFAASLGSNNIIIGVDVDDPSFTSSRSSNILIDNVVEINKDMITTYGTCNKVYLKDSSLTLTNGTAFPNSINKIEIEPHFGSLNYIPHSSNSSNQDFDINVKGDTVATFKSAGVGDLFTVLEAKGNLKVEGNIQLGESTINESSWNVVVNTATANTTRTFNNADEIATQRNELDALDTTLNNLYVEGFADGQINVATSSSNPSTGRITRKIKNANGSWVNGDAVVITNRDPYLRIEKDDFVIAININGEYRPIFVSIPF